MPTSPYARGGNRNCADELDYARYVAALRWSITIPGEQQTALLLLTGPLDGVGGWVFTRHIEHTFENREMLMMREVLL